MGDSLFGVNVWGRECSPLVVINSNLGGKQRRSTFGHELREIIENALGRVSTSYRGIPTNDNKRMNRESDHFAACLILQADATANRLREIGFDFVRFAAERGVPLAAVVRRAQEIFSSRSTRAGPHGGLFLFQTPWSVISQRDSIFYVQLQHTAKLCGFSLARPRSRRSADLGNIFPRPGSLAGEFFAPTEAIGRQRPVTSFVSIPDPTGDEPIEFMTVSEPLYNQQGELYQLLVSALRPGSADFTPWVERVLAEPVRRQKVL
jgi:hypothetical protein